MLCPVFEDLSSARVVAAGKHVTPPKHAARKAGMTAERQKLKAMRFLSLCTKSMNSELLSLYELYSGKPLLTRPASRTKNAREWTKKWRKLTLTNSGRPAIKTPM